MFYWLSELAGELSVLNVFRYITFRTGGALLTALLFVFLFGPRIITPFRWLYCLLIPFGAVANVEAVWNWGDICNGLQVFPNVIGLFALSGLAAAYARAHHPHGDKTH